MKFSTPYLRALALPICIFILAACSDKNKSDSPAVSGSPQAESAQTAETEEAPAAAIDKESGIPAGHTVNHILGWSSDSAHFGWVTVEKDSEGHFSWRLWVLNVITGVLPPFGNGTQIAQASAFTGEEYPDVNSRNKAAYKHFYGKYIDTLEQQGFHGESAMGETLYKAESLRETFKGNLKNEWSFEFKNAAMEKLVFSMQVDVSEKDVPVEKKPADETDSAAEKTNCKYKQSLLKLSLANNDTTIPQLINPGANYYFGVSAFHPILLSRSPNDNNIVVILEKYNDTECGEQKAGYIGIEANGGVIVGTQSAKNRAEGKSAEK